MIRLSPFSRIASGPFAAALALLLGIGFAWLGVQSLYPSAYTPVGWLWLLLAGLSAAYAFHWLQQHTAEPSAAAQPQPFAPVGRLAVGFGLMLAGLLLALVVVANLAARDNHQSMRLVWALSVMLWLAGSAVVMALGPGLWSSTRAEASAQPRSWRWLELAGVAVLLALAVFLRVYRLQQIPPGIFVDETNAALDALRIMEGRADSPFGTGWFETPTMYAYYLVGLFKLLGTTFLALKAASLLPAILTVAALYPLARLLFGVPTAFVATFLLAVSRWHITMSRWGWNEVAPLLFMVLALFFLLRALRDRRALDFALAGLWLGLGHYTYLASRLVALTVVGYLLYRLLFERRFAARAWRGLLLFVLVYLVTFAPLLVTYARNPFSFNNRSRQVSILVDMQAAYNPQQPPGQPMRALLGLLDLPQEVSLEPLQASVQQHVAMFWAAGDRNPRHNLPGAPMLDPLTGMLLALSLAFALWQALRPNAAHHGGHRYALLLLWLVTPLLGGILTRLEEAPQGYRTLPLIAAVALLAADAAVRSVRVGGAALTDTRLAAQVPLLRRLPAALLVVALLWAGVYNYRLFFQVQAVDGRVWQAFSPIETAVAGEVAAAMDDHSLYLSPRLYHFSPLKFLAYRSVAQGGGLDHPAYQVADPATDLPLSDPFGQDALFLLDTYYQSVPELFLAYYPGAQLQAVTGPGGQPLYLSVNVPGAEIRGLQGLYLSATLPDGAAYRAPYTDAPRFDRPADLAAAADLVWSGSLNIPASGEYEFAVDGAARLELDGTVWPSGTRRFLGKGLHAFRLQPEDNAAQTPLIVSWRQPNHSDSQPVPANYFFLAAPPAQGLLGQYFSGELWEGEPVFSRVDPLLLFAWPEAEPWPAPFSARWTGTLTAPVTGMYQFQVNADDGVRLWLDDQLVGESVVPDNVNLIQTQIELNAGPHAIRVDYFQRGGGKALELWWQPPGSILQPVPSAVLSPLSGNR
ncbi:MAG: PA14 domain-containing protein [Caldilineales bacterium]